MLGSKDKNKRNSTKEENDTGRTNGFNNVIDIVSISKHHVLLRVCSVKGYIHGSVHVREREHLLCHEPSQPVDM